ncbi:dTDP-glucose 4,6-dehydratase [compost metagenome]
MNAIVTGAAGFIGSTLVKTLLEKGYIVTGIDSLTDYYDVKIKLGNLEQNKLHPNFKFIHGSIAEMDWGKLYQENEYVFHLAGQPGVRSSWGTDFQIYTKNNIEATQIMLQAAIGQSNLKKFVYASTSSVYGDAEQFPTSETIQPRPISPYGVTKLAGENLGYLYFKNYNIPFVALRFFTVYGPGQRPDMAFQILFNAIKSNNAFRVYGDGKQTRDFTFVEDIVHGNCLAALHAEPGQVYNLGGGSRISMLEVFEYVKDITGVDFKIDFLPSQKGDAKNTSADITKAHRVFGYSPSFDLKEGLKKQWEWNREKM